MSIVKMQKVAIIGLDTEKENLVSHLMKVGAVELTDQTKKLTEDVWAENTTSYDNEEEIALYEGKRENARKALEVIEKHTTIKPPLFKTRRKMMKSQIEKLEQEWETYEKQVQYIVDLSERIELYTDRINSLDQDEIYLEPWVKFGVPLELEETASTKFFMGTIPTEVSKADLKRELEDEVGEVILEVISQDKEVRHIATLAYKTREEKTLEVLKKYGFSIMTFRDFRGTVTESLNWLKGERKSLKSKIKETEKEIVSHQAFQDGIEIYADVVGIIADKAKIKEKLIKTDRTFFMEGWLPERRVKEIEKILLEHQCYFQFVEPEEGEEVPVLMDNRNFFAPFESITEMYSLPDYRGFDPTSIFALFYAIFFGIMLSDAGYGLIMTIATLVVLKKYDLEGGAYKMVKLFFYCGISTTFWGFMFGGLFGNIVQVVADVFFKSDFALKAIWFEPINDPMRLLIFAVAMGVVHIFIGMGIKAYMQIREGKWLDALFDEGFWYLVITGAILWMGISIVAPEVAPAGKWMTIIGMAGLLLTGGRHNKGFGKVVGGLASIYNITSYLSDILSYSRLLALGLATGVIAQVVNTMGSLFGDGIVGGVLLLIIFVFGHTLNFAINALGSYVHACRLQYIEFFGKFYEDGGEAFQPFMKNTKYIKIIEDK